MALRAAVASGNWSSSSTWNGGVLPTVGDIVASNTYTVTIDQDINVDRLTNAAQAVVGAIPIMTSNTTPSGVVTASSSETGSFAAFNAFGGNFNTEWRPAGGPQWIAYEFPNPIAIDQYNVGTYGGTGDWTFEGWDGSSWVVLHTVTNTNFSYNSPLIGNSVAFIKYRLNYSISPPPRLHTIQFYEYLATTPATAGGGFILNDGVTVTCTSSVGMQAGSDIPNCLTYSGTETATINSNITPTFSNVATNTLVHSGTGTLNLNGNIFNHGSSLGNRQQTVLFSGNGVFNITGNVVGLQIRTGLRITNTGTCNIVGNLFGANSGNSIVISGNATVNITGNIFEATVGSSFTSILEVNALSAEINMTGNVFREETTFSISHGIRLTSTSRLNLIGNVYGTNSGWNGINATSSSYINIIGSIISKLGIPAFQSTGGGAINLLTGPFISGDSGVQPIFVTRMHYIRTMGSYYEFRDNSTLGALPPSPPAPATRLVSPDTVADSPIPRDVRQGTIYAEGSQTGTMIVPSRDNVAKGVLVDNTTGTAILDADSIWAVPLTSINTLNSIGRRVKNAATVESTGAQIQTTLNDNE